MTKTNFKDYIPDKVTRKKELLKRAIQNKIDSGKVDKTKKLVTKLWIKTNEQI